MNYDINLASVVNFAQFVSISFRFAKRRLNYASFDLVLTKTIFKKGFRRRRALKALKAWKAFKVYLAHLVRLTFYFHVVTFVLSFDARRALSSKGTDKRG